MATSADSGRSGSSPLGEDERAELAALRRRLGARRRWRAFVSALLITLAAILAPLSAVSVWIADVMGDTDRYVSTVAPLASQPDVQTAVTDLITNAVVSKVDLDSLLSTVAPKDRPEVEAALGGLSGPINGGLRNFVHGTVASFVSSDAFATIWTQLNRQAHTAFKGALTGEGDQAVQLRGDAVVLNLTPVVEQVKRQLVDRGLTIASRIPPVRADFTLVRSEDVRKARTWFRVLQLAGNWLPAVTLLLAAAGVLLAGRRRRALVAAALGIAAGVVLLGIALSLFRVVYLDHLPGNANERAAGAIYDQIVRFLWASVRMLIVLGVVVALGTWLSGPGRRARRVRGGWESVIAAVREACGVTSTGPVGPWVHRRRRVLQWVVVLAAVVALLLWSYPTGWVIFWTAVIVVAALAVIEFLDDRSPPRAARVTPP
ncbi:hypothetical protein OG552_14205 [Streptomyces sp. NBC_01476]|uniref:hypothetical protein n=1 Tax=Streptomyces sp. NBC_01476 TaxID=2903881 RepID=UPI002E312F3E|nr:hypothetical protein [Streptomyces sp. NBC_01476]